MKLPKMKGKWFETRDEFFIAWFFAMFLAGVIGNPRGLGGFSAGMNAGMALQYMFNRKFKRLIEKHRRQDEIDFRTLHDICAHATYKQLHQIAKSGMN